jgi:4-amino-4-deoxy-L-arabinose transferase-like glycosyltransferase
MARRLAALVHSMWQAATASSSRRWYPVVVFLLALAIRLGYAGLATRVDPFLRGDPLHGDAGSYDRIARNLAAGKGFVEWQEPTSFWPPLYPYLLAVVYGLFGYHPPLARAVHALLGALVCAAGAKLAGQTFGPRVAILAGLGLAFHPLLIYFGTWLIAEGLYLPIYGALLLAAARLQKHASWRALWLLGILLGLALLCKPTTLFLIPFLLLWLLAVPLRGCRAWAKAARLSAVFAVAVVVVLPWTVRNYLIHQGFILVSLNGGLTFLAANNAAGFGGHVLEAVPALPGVPAVEAEHIYYGMALQWITGHPGEYVRLLGLKLVRLFSPLSVATWPADYPLPGSHLVRAGYVLFLLLAAVGLIRSLPHWRETSVVYLPILQVVTACLVFYGDTRYSLPMQPSLVILAAFGLATLAGIVRPVHREAATSINYEPAP